MIQASKSFHTLRLLLIFRTSFKINLMRHSVSILSYDRGHNSTVNQSILIPAGSQDSKLYPRYGKIHCIHYHCNHLQGQHNTKPEIMYSMEFTNKMYWNKCRYCCYKKTSTQTLYFLYFSDYE